MNGKSEREQHKTVKAQAREYQRNNPGTKYTTALSQILRSTAAVPKISDVLVGQPEACKSLNDFAWLRKINQELRKRGKPVRDIPAGMVFVGPPGTGKSIAVELMAELLGLEGKVVHAGRSSLVGRWIGSTAERTREVVEDARGGILIVEDAGDFANRTHGQDPFGHEALRVLAQAVDDRECYVVLSGQDSTIRRLLQDYPFLVGRFPIEVQFTTLDTDSLLVIAQKFSAELGVSISDEALPLLRDRLADLTAKDHLGRSLIDLMGNARAARNAVDHALFALKERWGAKEDLSSVSDEELLTITAEDMSRALEFVLDPT